jgi:hypothetical protein
LCDGLASLAVGLGDSSLDGGNGFVARQDIAEHEETGLHDGVDASPHAHLFGDFVAIDDKEA